MSQAINELARAEANHTNAVAKHEAANASSHALVERRAQRQADADAAYAEYRAGGNEGVLGLRRQAALDDVADLDVMIVQSGAVLNALSNDVSRAANVVAVARQGVEIETRQAELVALQAVAVDLQEKLLGAVAEAVAIWVQLNPRSLRAGSASTVFQPSSEMRNLIVANDVPRRRAR